MPSGKVSGLTPKKDMGLLKMMSQRKIFSSHISTGKI